MKLQINGGIFAAALMICALFAGASAAQEENYIQLEAHSTQNAAVEFVPEYADEYDNLVGFQLLQTGWYVLALGPYPDRDSAESVRINLRSQNLIPFDAFVTQRDRYGEQFWPEAGARAVAVPDDAETLAQSPIDEAADPSAQPELPEEPAAEPEPPEETVAEARRSEAQLERDERALLQTALQWKGYYDLGIDAAIGPGTRRAMSAWQEDNGHEPTGVLTTRQRTALIEGYESERAAFGFETIRDDEAGIQITLPMGMVEFDRYEAPFAHYSEIDDSGVQVLLISQEGSLATLFGLYEIMQTLEIVPLEGFRERRSDSFVLTGQDDNLRSHSFAGHSNGQVKGYTLIWTPDQDERIERVLREMEDSFTFIDGVLPDGVGQTGSAVSQSDLLAGLEIRRPERSHTGFFIDETGRVLTSATLADQCGRLTIDERYDARVVLRDDDLGIIVLEPEEPLAPLAYAKFREEAPRLNSEVILAGFSFEDLLTRPVLTYGQLAALEGLNGERTLRRLSMEARPGDIGGPVFDPAGRVLGMLLPPEEGAARQLPDEVRFALSAAAIRAVLQENGVQPASIERDEALPGEELTLMASDMTVLVSCWR